MAGNESSHPSPSRLLKRCRARAAPGAACPGLRRSGCHKAPRPGRRSASPYHAGAGGAAACPVESVDAMATSGRSDCAPARGARCGSPRHSAPGRETGEPRWARPHLRGEGLGPPGLACVMHGGWMRRHSPTAGLTALLAGHSIWWRHATTLPCGGAASSQLMQRMEPKLTLVKI